MAAIFLNFSIAIEALIVVIVTYYRYHHKGVGLFLVFVLRLTYVYGPCAIAFACDEAVQEAEILQMKCFKLQQNFDHQSHEYQQLHSLAMFVSSHGIRFTAAGFFEVKRSTVLSLLATATTIFIALNKLKTVCIFGGSFLFFTAIAILMGKPPSSRPNIGLSIYEFCQKHGYQIKDETLTTEDGYILTLHRLGLNKTVTNSTRNLRKPPVLLMHGLYGSSVDYVAGGPNKSLAFQLVNKGYDVWLGNQRGNSFSREHVMLDPDMDPSFWNFSFHEIGTIDVPAMVDYITDSTNFPKITYVGMSQGSLAYLVMTSSKPKYNNKILLSNVLAPVITLYNTKNFVFRIWSMFNFFIEPFINFWGPMEVGGSDQFITNVMRYLCLGPHKIANWYCTEYLVKYVIGSSDQLDYDILPFHLSHIPAGAAMKQFLHFIQNKGTGQLAQYDYYDNNEEHYNQDTPPIYNLTKSTAPLAVYYSRGDVYTNIEKLYHELRTIPNVVLKYKVPNVNFNHLDFVYAKDINVLLYKKLIDLIDTFNKR